MKALKSPLAKEVLADPKAKGQLRSFLASKSAARAGEPELPAAVIEFRSNGRTVRVKPVVVPKAA